jgi:hypothetical protein
MLLNAWKHAERNGHRKEYLLLFLEIRDSTTEPDSK